ncbi:MAG: flavin reductase family protein [Planctomycetota bacterium]|nr:flavin reductase family protein [Planctomycetota bacterium]
MIIDPEQIDQADRYKLLIGGIVPRPIAWVSTLSKRGEPNLAPFSFFCGVSSRPMSLAFCPANKPDGTLKDTLRNILETSDDGAGTNAPFVVNIVSMELARQMAATAEELDHGSSEFDLAGLATAPSTSVAPPRVEAAALAFECLTISVTTLAPAEPGGGNIVVGRVQRVYARDNLVTDRHHIDPAQLDAVGRMAGLTYCSTRDRFDIPWGRAALA